MNKNLQYLCLPLLEKAIKEALRSRIEIKFFDLMQQPKSCLLCKTGPPQKFPFLKWFLTLLAREGSSNVISNESQLKIKTYNGEFDPGSGWTLAAGLTHASRTVTEKACFLLTSGERVRNAYATYLFLRNSPEKFGLIPYNNIHSHVWIFKAFAEKDGHAWH